MQPPVPAVVRGYPAGRLFDESGNSGRSRANVESVDSLPSTSTSRTILNAAIMNTVTNSELIDAIPLAAPPAAGDKSSREPSRKRRKRAATGTDFQGVEGFNHPSTPEPASRSLSPAVTRRTRGRSMQRSFNSRGKRAIPRSEQLSCVENNLKSPTPTPSEDVVSHTSLSLTKLAHTKLPDIPLPIKTQETTIQFEGIEYDDHSDDDDGEGEEEEDYKDFIPQTPQAHSQVGAPNGTASSRRSGHSSRRPEPINKVKNGRISKFKEGSMNDRASIRPPPELIGYAYANHGGASEATSEVSNSTTSTSLGSRKRWLKPQFRPRKYTGDEVFTLEGFITSVIQFRGFEYIKENLWGPSKQRLMDKLHVDLQKIRQDTELNEIKAKAEEVYKARKEKEWKEMEIKKQKATEELRRRKQRELERKQRKKLVEEGKLQPVETRTAGTKRKRDEMAESFGDGENERAWDEAEEEATDIDGEVGLESAEDRPEPLEVREEDVCDSGEESNLDPEELAKIEELARIVTGKEIVAKQVQSNPSSVAASSHASPSRRRRLHIEETMDEIIFSQESELQFKPPPPSAFVDSSDDECAHTAYESLLKRGSTKGKDTAPSENTATNGHRRNGISSKDRTSKNLGGGGAKAGGSSSSPSRASSVPPVFADVDNPQRKKFTKRQIQKQERLRRKVTELETKLLDTWMELEAAGGVTIRLTPSNTSSSNSSSSKPVYKDVVNDAMGPPPLPLRNE